jgi:Cdc6-like AAA superfamily ATPase
MPLDLSIRDLTIPDTELIIDPAIPSIPFNAVIYGKSGSGKTNLLKHLVKFYKKCFNNRVIIFTKSVNGTLYSLIDSIGAVLHNDLFDSDGNDIICDILRFQNERKESGGKLQNVLIILDDFVLDNSFHSKRGIYEKLYSMGRHANISIITTSQQYTLLPASIRRLAWYIMIFKISNQNEKRLMCYEMCNTIDKSEAEFERVYNNAVSEPFSFLYIDAKKGKFSTRFGV